MMVHFPVKTATVWPLVVAQFLEDNRAVAARQTPQDLRALLLLDIIPKRLLTLCIALINIRR
jgi:hypothetical protein